jgi:hypothetical protein
MNVLNKGSDNKVGVNIGINRPVSGVYKPMRPVTPDKQSDVKRDLNIKPNINYGIGVGVGGGIGRPMGIQQNNQLKVRPKTPDAIPKDRQLIIKKK